MVATFLWFKEGDFYISFHIAGPNWGGGKEMSLEPWPPVQSHQTVVQECLREMVSIVMMEGTLDMI